MTISIDPQKLDRHRTILEDELDEIYILRQILDEWECAAALDSSVDSSFFAHQRRDLEKQGGYISNRVRILELIVEELTAYQRCADDSFAEAKAALDSLGI